MRADDRGVQQNPVEIRLLQCREDPLPATGARPAAKALIDRVPLAVALGEITPGRPTARDPEHGVEEQPVVHGTATWRAHATRQQRFYPTQF